MTAYAGRALSTHGSNLNFRFVCMSEVFHIYTLAIILKMTSWRTMSKTKVKKSKNPRYLWAKKTSVNRTLPFNL